MERLTVVNSGDPCGCLPGFSAEQDRQSIKNIPSELSCVRNYVHLLVCAKLCACLDMGMAIGNNKERGCPGWEGVERSRGQG